MFQVFLCLHSQSLLTLLLLFTPSVLHSYSFCIFFSLIFSQLLSCFFPVSPFVSKLTVLNKSPPSRHCSFPIKYVYYHSIVMPGWTLILGLDTFFSVICSLIPLSSGVSPIQDLGNMRFPDCCCLQ